MGRRAQTRQADRRTGRVYVCETECRCGKGKRRAVLANRRLIGHVDPDTGGVVANRKAKPSGPAPASRREFHGATCLFDRIAEACGVKADMEHAAPGCGNAVLSVACCLPSEDSSPLSRFGRWPRTHWHPFGSGICSQRSSGPFAALDADAKERFCALQAKRRDEDGYWLYDSTSISSWSETLSHVRWGRNKDRVPLAQINLGSACLGA